MYVFYIREMEDAILPSQVCDSDGLELITFMCATMSLLLTLLTFLTIETETAALLW